MMDAMQNCTVSARELAGQIRARVISAREVMTAHLARIQSLNPAINAIVAKLPDEQCLALAAEADAQLASGKAVGPLHGLPWAFKDTEAAIGFPFTQGSPIFRDFQPADDTIVVQRIRRAGAITIGKTNVPEFAMGSHTYNHVYGTTRNPYDLSKSAGGSSGGAAAAVTCGMLPLADGGDLGGSIRNPANFNNIVGLRPSVGLVPVGPGAFPYGFSVKGPLARSVADVAFLLSVIAGPDARDHTAYPSDPSVFATLPERDFKGVRIAWCPDLGGLPLDPRVRDVLQSQRATFEQLGCIVEDAVPELDAAEDIFLTIRRWKSFTTLGSLLSKHRHAMKPEAIEEIERGASISAAEIAQAMTRHSELMQKVATFQQRFPFLVCAVNQVPPFDADIDWPHEVAGVKMSTYTEWMRSAYLISATMCPAISVPAGFTPERLPVGIQIVGRYRDDLGVLQLAAAFEAATRVGKIRPQIAIGDKRPDQ
jgi:amidase